MLSPRMCISRKLMGREGWNLNSDTAAYPRSFCFLFSKRWTVDLISCFSIIFDPYLDSLKCSADKYGSDGKFCEKEKRNILKVVS